MKRFLLKSAVLAAVLGIGIGIPAAVVLCSYPAHAEEDFLGTIVSAAGADTVNTFVVIPGIRLSIQCTAAAYFITDDVTAVTATRGVNIASGALFLTKTGTQPTQAIGGKISAILRIAGPAAVTCTVWSRKGDE